jgi:putative membrane protein|tara:strand:+ start:56 stop:637 length:582 start_codon:yes stop_codon:yes gene_type:complete
MKRNLRLPTIFVYSFLIILLIYFAINQNHEFSIYGIATGLLYYLILVLDKKYNFPTYSVWLFAIWAVLHMLGGSAYISGIRFYDLMLIQVIGDPFFILKYDQFVHAFCYVAFSILIYHVLKNHFKPNQERALIIFTILAASGVGLLNEVLEFGMVIFAGAGEAVGGYYNTALDMVFNVIGAIIGTLYTSRKYN